ncbi:D-2-hydroxyacid dehydrogenase family protein [Sphingobacterium sp. SRCM116780]|uniref:D-2-hydroxyacid dehydrogenase family protein n=1 Tax=Sphingobacterium sp. SRCM116780 TaxID=2907623 RepID=UPI001F3C1EB4|nr:D-2-hydroxyacid dehydrogenase family protein [Sphingobacterium sp. SRCM116780]UIR56962.1 D-2-hydroxyacid dehydrogenase family protein [Sphingobacterium sp. SRCM116780]
MKITILDDYQNVIETLKCFERLSGQHVEILHKTEKDPNKLSVLLSDTEILVLTRERTEITDELLNKLPKLKLISQTGKISNHLDLNACTKYKVSVAEGVGSPIAPAELTWALLMNTVRQIPQAIEGLKDGKWQINIGTTINGKILGIWGYGKIGQKIAQYAKVFGAKVVVWGSESSRKKAVEDGFEQAESKEFFFRNVDIVTLHLRLNEQTIGIVKEADLLNMKETSVLINTARAELIEKNGLENVLKSGKNMLVGIDVYETEPIYDKDFELLKMNNVVCTPHLGYVEQNGYELYFGKAFENVINYINGNPTNIANPETLN